MSSSLRLLSESRREIQKQQSQSDMATFIEKSVVNSCSYGV